MLKKMVVWGGIAFVIFFVAMSPSAAANVIRNLGNVAVDIFQGVGRFLTGG